MILLDTNVISEPLRPTPNARVVAWLDAQSLETLFLSAITVAELRFGIAALPAGKRRDRLGKTSSGASCRCSSAGYFPSTCLPHRPTPN